MLENGMLNLQFERFIKLNLSLQDYRLAYSKMEYTYTISKMSLLELDILYKIYTLILKNCYFFTYIQ